MHADVQNIATNGIIGLRKFTTGFAYVLSNSPTAIGRNTTYMINIVLMKSMYREKGDRETDK